MPKKYDGLIDRHTDFTHAGPNGEPASGLAIQRYIKGIDAKKVGIGYTLEDGSAHLFFADEEDMLTYQADPTAEGAEDLIIDRIEMEALYKMRYNLLTPAFVPVFLGAAGNYIRYTFTTLNRDDQPIGESVTVTYTITRGSSTQVVTENYRAGTTVAFKVDQYLLEGTNSISINIKGDITKVSTIFGVTYQVINLVLQDAGMDISKVHTLSAVASVSAEVPYVVEGAGRKIMEWYLDGVQLEYIATEDEITESHAERIKYIPLDGLTQGRHSIQFRVGIEVSGETFYSKTFYREVIVSAGNDAGAPVAVIGTEFPVSAGVLGEDDPLVLYPTQYESLQLKLAAWNPDGTYRNTVDISLDGSPYASVECVLEEEAHFETTFMTSGAHSMVLTIGEESRTIGISAAPTSMNIEEITRDRELAFSANGRTNASANRDQWSDGQHSATFSGFHWTETSGWNGGRLVVPSGASVAFDYAPLGVDPSLRGKTIEMEFSVKDVDDPDAVLIDMMSGDVGICVTATRFIVKSAGHVTLSREFKENENIRLSIVINRHTGVANRNLIFAYINGINSMAGSMGENDNVTSDKQLTIGGTGAGISIKQILVYDTALPADSILNNYELYRDTVEEMLAVYDRNDLYEEGTSNFDINKIAAYLPVMVITGNIPAIEGTTDKKLQIVADIQYTNLQDPSRSFTMEKAIITGQGTSSMRYPKKNLLIYTDKSDATVLRDAEDNVVADGRYSFKEGAQRVSRWCLKTDFAESSGTHNTGVARIMNEVLMRAKVNDEYVLRTEAQKTAAANDYPYDVRTTIDGFPIVVFYHIRENDNLIFLGKYNFNNDKSTESVFGFEGIPGFDHSDVQCFEFLDSGNRLALFQTMEGFDENWDQAWESRYPDTKTPVLQPLKDLATWIVSTKDADPSAEEGTAAKLAFDKWQSEKAQHFDLYKLAAYYVYLMRFGAVDQTVKNSMLMTEDGQHWFFILYDNDTILGVRNDGLLRFPPTIDRQTLDEELGGFAYAGHGSVLWNNFEADPECMALAKQVDAALYSAGLTYEGMIEMFNIEQAGKWAEKIYNQDAQYKYIGTGYFGSMQGSRSEHRKWWISNRFALYDALFVNGSYTGNVISLLIPNAPQGTTFSVVSGKDFYYGFGVNNKVLASGVHISAGNSHTFTLTENVEIGSPLGIYAPYYLQSLDLSNLITYIGTQNFNLSAAYNPVLGSKMKTLILGVSNPATDDRRNNALVDPVGLDKIVTLENLNVAGYTALIDLNLSTLVNLRTFKAKASGLTGVSFASGAPLSSIEMPASLQSLVLRNLTSLTTAGIDLEDGGENIRLIEVRGCPAISNSPSLLLDWIDTRLAGEEDYSVFDRCEVYMDNINWPNITPADLLKIGAVKRYLGDEMTLRGTCRLTTASQSIVQQITDCFGETAFQPGAPFYISAPDSMYVTVSGDGVSYDETNNRYLVLEGVNAQLRAVVFSDHPGGITWTKSGTRTGVDMVVDEAHPERALFTTTELSSGNIVDFTITCRHRPTEGSSTSETVNVRVLTRKYPTDNQVSITGSPAITVGQNCEFGIAYSVSDITGNMNAAWSLTGDLANHASIISQSNANCVVKMPSTPSQVTITGTLTLTLTKVIGGSVCSPITKQLVYTNNDIAVSAIVNPYAMACLHNAGLSSSPDYMTKQEAADVRDVDLQPGTGQSTSIFYADSDFRNRCANFDEFQYFTGLTMVPRNLFRNCVLENITLPPQIETIEFGAFYECTRMTTINIPSGVTSIASSAFYRCSLLDNITIPSSVTSIGTYAFSGCSHLSSLIIQEGVTTIGVGAFTDCSSLTSITIPDSVIEVQYNAFLSCRSLTSITIGTGLTTVGGSAFAFGGPNYEAIIKSGMATIPEALFKDCRGLTSVSIPGTVTTIGSYAFSGCSGLTSITLPYSVTSIGQQAFSGCSGLTSITIPNSVTSIGAGAFSNCSGLTTIHIPDSTTSIGNYAFSNCSNLASITVAANNSAYTDGAGCNCIIARGSMVLIAGCKNTTIPNGVTSLGQSCFAGITGLTSISIPNSVTSIQSNAFSGCSGLTSITIPSGVTSIGTYAFSGCSSLTSITIPSGVRTIETYTFNGCSNLASVTLPNTVRSIDSYAFQNCTSLDSISIPDSVTYLGWASFQGSGLSSIDIGSGMTRIYQNAFASCNSLHSMTVRATTPPTVDGAAALPGTMVLTSIYVPSDSVTAYKGASGWDTYASVISAIPAGVFIAYTDGTRSNYDTLDSGKTPIGVAVIDSDVSFVIHPSQIGYTGNYYSDDTSTIISGVESVGSNSGTISAFSGRTNTVNAIASGLAGPLFTSAANAVYADGRTGYLPSIGQLIKIYSNLTNINTALQLIGGDLISENYGSSTQKNAGYYWRGSLDSPYYVTNNISKTSTSYGRSIADYAL